MAVIPGLIDGHDHLASHGYALTRRWGLEEPQSTTHMRTAAVLQYTLATGYTTVRDAAGLEAGKLADIVVVAGDPLRDITILQDLSRIKLVFKGGHICVDRRVEHAVAVE